MLKSVLPVAKMLPLSVARCSTIPASTRLPLIGSRFQSTTSTTDGSSTVPVDRIDPLSDAQVDQWLESISDLRAELTKTGFSPESILAPPGRSKVDVEKETERLTKPKFTPTEEQVKEWEALRGVPLPTRTDPVLQHVTNMIMRDGKKQLAERLISRALYLMFCQTRSDPIELLKKSLDDLAPLMIVKTFNTGVAKAAVIPVPLNKRQRTRMAWKWIIDAANQRASSDFAVRLAEELIAVSNGIGSCFDKRDQLHKTAIAHRSYIKLK